MSRGGFRISSRVTKVPFNPTCGTHCSIVCAITSDTRNGIQPDSVSVVSPTRLTSCERERRRATTSASALPPITTARLTVHLHDVAWDILYAPVARAVGFAADRLNHLQFLTIRRYMAMVFVALVILLAVLALWR